MIPFDFAKNAIRMASDFEDTAQRIAHDLGLDVEDLKQRAADYSAVSPYGPIEALHHLAVAAEGRAELGEDE